MELDLEEKIRSQHYEINDYLPNEMDLCSVYDVSRITIRRALSELENKGFISRTSGKGTMVTYDHDVDKNVTIVKSISNELSEIGKIVSTSDLSLKVITANMEKSAILGVSMNSKLIQLNRVRTVDGEIIAFSESYFPLIDNMSTEESDYSDSLMDYFESLGIELTYSNDSLEAVLPPPEVCDKLQTNWYDPVLKRTKLSKNDDLSFSELSIIYYIGSKYIYQVETA